MYQDQTWSTLFDQEIIKAFQQTVKADEFRWALVQCTGNVNFISNYTRLQKLSTA